MAEDTRALIEQARAKHHDDIDYSRSVWRPWCYSCQAEYPCLVARLAEALEEQASETATWKQRAASEARHTLAVGEKLQAAERRAAEMDVARAIAVDRADSADRHLAKTHSFHAENLRQLHDQIAALTRELAAAREREKRLETWAREKHTEHCLARPHYFAGKLTTEPCNCGLAAALAAGEADTQVEAIRHPGIPTGPGTIAAELTDPATHGKTLDCKPDGTYRTVGRARQRKPKNLATRLFKEEGVER